jgi:hypothetical protein
MSELRVPTLVLPVEIECADGRLFSGRVFIPAASAHHDGPTRPEEWMNDASHFFAFLPDESDTPVLMNKREVLVLSVPTPSSPLAEGETQVESPVMRVRVEAEKRRIDGELVIDMPPNQARVLDYLNRAEGFLLLREGSVRHLIQKERITRVIEVREE